MEEGDISRLSFLFSAVDLGSKVNRIFIIHSQGMQSIPAMLFSSITFLPKYPSLTWSEYLEYLEYYWYYLWVALIRPVSTRIQGILGHLVIPGQKMQTSAGTCCGIRLAVKKWWEFLFVLDTRESEVNSLPPKWIFRAQLTHKTNLRWELNSIRARS